LPFSIRNLPDFDISFLPDFDISFLPDFIRLLMPLTADFAVFFMPDVMAFLAALPLAPAFARTPAFCNFEVTTDASASNPIANAVASAGAATPMFPAQPCDRYVAIFFAAPVIASTIYFFILPLASLWISTEFGSPFDFDLFLGFGALLPPWLKL
jgi:hypothetical protein